MTNCCHAAAILAAMLHATTTAVQEYTRGTAAVVTGERTAAQVFLQTAVVVPLLLLCRAVSAVHVQYSTKTRQRVVTHDVGY